MKTIFETGMLDYPDLGLEKPVKFDLKDLEAIAKKTSSVEITDEHSKEVLGVLSDFVVEDGKLMANVPNDIEISGKGWSPVFDTELVDMGDYYRPSLIKMTSVGLSKTPRNKILYNTVSTKDTEADMGESALEKVIREKDELQKKIGVLEANEERYKRLIDGHKEEIEKIKESYSDEDREKLEEENKALKEKADAYDNFVEGKRQELIQEIVGDDDKLAEEYQSFSIENLELVLKTRKASTNPQGVSSNDYPTDDGSNPSEEEETEEYTDEMFEAEFEASGL